MTISDSDSLSSSYYFNYLTANVMLEPEYIMVAAKLYKREFVVFVDGDENRVDDAYELRELYNALVHRGDICLDEHEMTLAVSVLEVLVALSVHYAPVYMDVYGSNAMLIHEFFMNMLKELDLNVYTNGEINDETMVEIDDIITRFIERDYGFNGYGSLFPQDDTKLDLQNTEIFAQMINYYG